MHHQHPGSPPGQGGPDSRLLGRVCPADPGADSSVARGCGASAARDPADDPRRVPPYTPPVREWAILTVASISAMIGPACFDAPSYEGLACSVEEPCPRGFVCTSGGTCRTRELVLPADGGALEAPAACEVIDPLTHVPRGTGFDVTYHPLGDDGAIDRGTCLRREELPGDTLSFTPSTSAAELGVPRLAATLVGRRTFPGATILALDHAGGLRIVAGGITIYDTFRDGPREAIAFRTYLGGAQSLVFDLAVEGPSPHATVEWLSDCTVDQARLETDWQILYRRALGAPDYLLDRGECLGYEAVPSEALSKRFGQEAPAALLALGITDDFGAELTATRTFDDDTPVSVFHDDGLRLWVDGALIYQRWSGSLTVRTTITVPAGRHQLTAEWFDHLGDAGLELTW